jgi:putative endonuclease
MDRRSTGAAAESVARDYLCARGLQLLCENYRCRGGELDLVFIDGDALVVVEVRLRASDRYGGAVQSIDFRKRRRIELATRHLLMTDRRLQQLRVRFDVVTFDASVARSGDVEWIRDAWVL